MIYSIVDVETTGRGNKITEIAIFKTDGLTILDEFSTLINPESLIPTYITALTGIDNLMVAKAPTFEEVADKILEFTEDTVFVAHHVNFDYNVIRNEFKALGKDFRRRKLCTVRLSRTLFPSLKSYGLGKLCKALNIPIIDRHRARGDAEATTILFKRLMAQPKAETVFRSTMHKFSKESTLPAHLPAEVFEALPITTGIYYFKDKKGRIIYVGKAKNIKKRVLGHFYNKSEKELSICRETADIDFKLSGSELIALLMEDAAIKHYFPKYNSASKKPIKKYAIFHYEDRQGVLHLAFNDHKRIRSSIQTFFNIRDCRSYLEEICERFELCPKFCHLQEGVDHCDHYKLKACHGICRGHEDITEYNKRVNEAMIWMKKQSKNIVIKQKGRSKNEDAFVLLRNGKYLGYGFIDKEEQVVHEEQLDTYLIRQRDNIDIQRILRSSLVKPSSFFKLQDSAL